jgi:hypothetical protein
MDKKIQECQEEDSEEDSQAEEEEMEKEAEWASEEEILEEAAKEEWACVAQIGAALEEAIEKTLDLVAEEWEEEHSGVPTEKEATTEKASASKEKV